jgi:hypothetical protein
MAQWITRHGRAARQAGALAGPLVAVQESGDEMKSTPRRILFSWSVMMIVRQQQAAIAAPPGPLKRRGFFRIRPGWWS